MNVNSLPASIGRYRILEEIGRGSMGRVYSAHDPNIGRKVALKVVHPGRELSDVEREELRKRFVLEARAAGRLNHPNVVTVYDAQSGGDGDPYIAMEHVEGRSLLAILREKKRLPIRTAVALGTQVARALDYAHSAGIVHRDVKPANILVASSGMVKLSDFGVAKLTAECHTEVGQLLGTPHYMSPEQVRNQPIDGRSDLFCLGIVLSQCLTGKVPFGGPSIAAISWEIVHGPAEVPSEANPDVPEALDAVVLKLLAKNPADRYDTGEDAARALEAIDLPPERDSGAFLAASTTIARPEARDALRVLALESPPAPGPDPGAVPEAETAIVPPGGERQRSRLGAGALLVVALAALVAGAVLRRSRHEGPTRAPVPRSTSPIAQAPELPQPVAPPPAVSIPASPQPVPIAASSPKHPAAATLSSPPEAAPFPEEADGRDRELPTPLGSGQPAMVDLHFENRLSLAVLRVSLDGRIVATRKLVGDSNPFRRIGGRSVRVKIPVEAGNHRIGVEIEGESMKVRARAEVRGEFAPNQSRRLVASLNAYTDDLELEWKR